MARGRQSSQKSVSQPQASQPAAATSQQQAVVPQATSRSAAAASQHQSPAQTSPLSEWRERKRHIRETQVEHGKKLQEKLQDMRSKGLLHAKKRQTLSQQSGLEFPVRRVIRHMKELNPNRIVYEKTGVMMAGVVEYLCAEVLELAGNTAKAFNKKRISPREIFLAVKNDVELDQLLEDATMAFSGTLPNIHPSLLKKHKAMPASLEQRKQDTSRVSFFSPTRESMTERVEHVQAEMATPTTRKTQA